MASQTYDSNLTDDEWSILSDVWPPRSVQGAPPKWSTREIVNAVLYVLRGGIARRALPHEFPPWETVSSHFRQLRLAGVWERINTALPRIYRVRIGRTPDPHAAIIDSQSAKTTESGGPRGFDGNKKVNGRKRHILVDTLGLVCSPKTGRSGLDTQARPQP